MPLAALSGINIGQREDLTAIPIFEELLRAKHLRKSPSWVR